MRFTRLASLALCTALAAPSMAAAGPLTDKLGQCLVASATPADRTVLMRWMFTMMVLHPDIQDLAQIDPAKSEDASKQAGALFQRLLVADCRADFIAAYRAEQMVAVQGSFQVLGQVAGEGLFSAPEVAAGMSSLVSHVDQNEMNALFTEAMQQP